MRREHVPDSCALECPDCEKIRVTKVVGHYSYLEEGPGYVVRYLFAKCSACSAPLVAAQINDDDWEDDHDFTEPVRYLPRMTRVGLAVPQSAATQIVEASRCFTAAAYSATALMCRAAIESMIKEHGISSRTLAEGLKVMHAKGQIEKLMFDWADALRLTGNEAAHGEPSSVTKVDAKDLLEFTGAILEYVYTFRVRFEAFQTRRAKRMERTTHLAGLPEGIDVVEGPPVRS